jgi:hypothetical protein
LIGSIRNNGALFCYNRRFASPKSLGEAEKAASEAIEDIGAAGKIATASRLG